MNIRMVTSVLGSMFLIEAALLLLPLGVSLLAAEGLINVLAWLVTIVLLAVCGLLLRLTKPHHKRFYTREGLVIASLSWLFYSFFGCLPFYISGEIPRLVDAFFETCSGLTTTGSSILLNIEGLSRSMLFWRSFTHWVGGMGVLVLALAVLPSVSSESVHIMRAEVPGPTFGKLVAKLKETARILYFIYLVMTVLVIILLLFGGMDLFEATLHAFGAAGTGGFGVKNNSIAYYDSTYIHLVLGGAMLAFGINFNLYYLLLLRQFRKIWRSDELRWYLGIVAGATLLIAVNVAPLYESVPRLLRDVFFTVSSMMTTTGYSTADFGSWPLLSHIVLLILMFIGASAGSTAGGLKVSRVVTMFRTSVSEVRQALEPKRVLPVIVEGQPVYHSAQRAIGRYFLIYMGLFSGLVLLMSLFVPDFISAFSSVAATFNNIGPGLGVVGPTGNYAGLPDAAKLILSFAMLAGRLELFPVLVLFLPSTWRRLH